MKKISTLFLIIFGFTINSSYSQLTEGKIIPPSPNAASLGQYADIPVSNYTGIPNISIPLFNIKSGKIEFPISVSYHASGIKVAQEASLVGLGWALNAGGVITRQVRGSDDFKDGGFPRNTVPPSTTDYLSHTPGAPGCPPSASTPIWGQYYHWINYPERLYRIDGEPDIFYFNFMGFSGQFFFKEQNGGAGGLTATCVDQSNLKIIYNGKWIITDGNGWTYFFGDKPFSKENTTDYDYTYEGTFNSNPYFKKSRNIMGYDYDTESNDTAWYITKVITPDGDTIEFEYYDNNNFISLSNLQYSERIIKLVNPPSRPVVTANQHFSSFSQQAVKDVYLKKIIFKNGYIDFKTEDREDLRKFPNYSYIQKPQKIKSAELFDINNNSIKKITFNYNYFNEFALQDNEHKEDFLRLRLGSIEEQFKDKTTGSYKSHPPYIFSYNTTVLPDKLSFSIDHWGYYNDKNNESVDIHNNGYKTATLTPSYINKDAANVKFIQGADRSVNTSTAQAATLNEIHYPTGGSMKLNYESNTYSLEEKYAFLERETIYLWGGDYSDHYTEPEEKEETFTIIEPTFLDLNFRLYGNDSMFSDNPTPFVGQAYLKKIGGNIIKSLDYYIPRDEWGNYTFSEKIYLEPGTYQIYVDNGTEDTSDVTFDGTYEKLVENPYYYKKNGPGIRIKEIETVDKENKVKIKKYSYDEEEEIYSSGRLMSPINYWYNESLSISDNTDVDSDLGSYDGFTNFIVRVSNSIVPFGYSAKGKLLGYNRVTISDTNLNNELLGDIQYFYKNSPDIPSNSFLPGALNIMNLSNGQLLKEIYRNNNMIKVKEKSYLYNSSQTFTRAVKKYAISFPYQQTCHYVYDPPPAIGTILPATQLVKIFNIQSQWSYLKQTTETIFDINGLNPITTTTNFIYSNPLHKNLTETQTTNSKGQTIISKSKYPQDLLSGIDETPSSTISNMVAANVINTVIQSETTINGNLTQATINNFKIKSYTDENNNTQNTYLLKNIKKLKGGSGTVYDKKVDFVDYGKYGNLTEYKQANGSMTVYLWGYKEEYPVAKVENSTLSEVEGALTTIELSNIKSGTYDEATMIAKLNKIRTSLVNSIVTTYTYKPLVGITTVTDPKGNTVYYTYDTAGRLQFVKDAQGNLLSENQYHYKN